MVINMNDDSGAYQYNLISANKRLQIEHLTRHSLFVTWQPLAFQPVTLLPLSTGKPVSSCHIS
jgi:hypothetical protein